MSYGCRYDGSRVAFTDGSGTTILQNYDWRFQGRVKETDHQRRIQDERPQSRRIDGRDIVSRNAMSSDEDYSWGRSEDPYEFYPPPGRQQKTHLQERIHTEQPRPRCFDGRHSQDNSQSEMSLDENCARGRSEGRTKVYASQGWQHEPNFQENIQTEKPRPKVSDGRAMYRHSQDNSESAMSFNKNRAGGSSESRTEVYPSQAWQHEPHFQENMQTEQSRYKMDDERDIYSHPQANYQNAISSDENLSRDRSEGPTDYYSREFQNPAESPQRLTKFALVKIICKRLVSIALIILDAVNDWRQYADMDGPHSIKISAHLSLLGIKNKSCSQVIEAPQYLFLVLSILGSLYSTFQIINIIGETIFEIKRGQKKDKKEKTWTGFRLAHGFKETAFGAGLIQLPQIMLLAIFSWGCYCDSKEEVNKKRVKLIISLVSGYLKDTWRSATCLKKPKPCCKPEPCCNDCCCCDPKCHVDCCIVECDLCGSEACHPKFCWEGLCDGFSNLCNGCCDSSFEICGVSDKDPEWASSLYSFISLLQLLLSLFCGAGMVCSL